MPTTPTPPPRACVAGGRSDEKRPLLRAAPLPAKRVFDAALNDGAICTGRLSTHMDRDDHEELTTHAPVRCPQHPPPPRACVRSAPAPPWRSFTAAPPLAVNALQQPIHRRAPAVGLCIRQRRRRAIVDTPAGDRARRAARELGRSGDATRRRACRRPRRCGRQRRTRLSTAFTTPSSARTLWAPAAQAIRRAWRVCAV